MSIQAILAASQSMSRMQTMQSARTQIQGTANILRSEIRQDGGNEQKEAKVKELEEKSSKLMGDLMTDAKEVTETLKPDEGIKEDATAKEGTPAERSPQTDVVEFSDSATRQLEAGTPAKPVFSEAVTYKADGSQKASAPNNVAQTFKATA